MESDIGKVCPLCKINININDEMEICEKCGTPYHKVCWEENKGCVICESLEKHDGIQGSRLIDVCSNCSFTLEYGQEFCPKCGTQKGSVKKKSCRKCGAELKEGQQFCVKCGQKTQSIVNNRVSTAIKKLNNIVEKKKAEAKKNPIKIGIIVSTIIVCFILITALLGNDKDFNKMYSDIKNESWCEIATDGSWMKIDTNPYDNDDYNNPIAVLKIKSINEDLGFQSSLYQKMIQTRALDGRQSSDIDKVEASWTYHPNKGIEVIYEWKN